MSGRSWVWHGHLPVMPASQKAAYWQSRQCWRTVHQAFFTLRWRNAVDASYL